MKRDIDLVRRILLETEGRESPFDASELVSDCDNYESVYYHVDMMHSHGLLDADFSRDMNGKVIRCKIKALTWDGCDYIDAMRSDMVFEKTKRAVKETVESTTLGAFMEVAQALATEAILNSLGI